MLQGAQQAKTGTALQKLQELQAADGATLDEREIQLAGIEVENASVAHTLAVQAKFSQAQMLVLRCF